MRRRLVAVGQENAFPWIERDLGLAFDEWGMPVLDPVTLQSSLPRVFFGGDAALGPKNIIWAVAQGHAAAISIDKFLNGEDVSVRPAPGVTLVSQKMGIHEWTYDNDITTDLRSKVPWRDINQSLRNIKVEVELGFDVATAWKEAQRCLNCDVQTVFNTVQCIECDACVDICPTDCISFTANGEEADLRTRLHAPARNLDQALYVSSDLKTGRVMVKDEDVCLHCGLCAERCPTGAWDMQKFMIKQTRAGHGCRTGAKAIKKVAPDMTSNVQAGTAPRLEAVNDFVVKFANVNGSGSASANELFARSLLRMGVPVSPRNIFPFEHPGPAHLVRGARQREGLAGAARRRRPDGGDEPADLGQGPRGDRAGGYLLYDSSKPMPASAFAATSMCSACRSPTSAPPATPIRASASC
jgi:ferredoxin